jgi:hypothetical protein
MFGVVPATTMTFPPSATGYERTPTSKFRVLSERGKGCDYNHTGS